MVIGSDGSVTSVPKGANTLEGNLPTEKTMMWHMIFCHIGEKGLRSLKNKNLIKGLKDCNLEFDFCEHCVTVRKIMFSFTLVLTNLLMFWTLFILIFLVLLKFLQSPSLLFLYLL